MPKQHESGYPMRRRCNCLVAETFGWWCAEWFKKQYLPISLAAMPWALGSIGSSKVLWHMSKTFLHVLFTSCFSFIFPFKNDIYITLSTKCFISFHTYTLFTKKSPTEKQKQPHILSRSLLSSIEKTWIQIKIKKCNFGRSENTVPCRITPFNFYLCSCLYRSEDKVSHRSEDTVPCRSFQIKLFSDIWHRVLGNNDNLTLFNNDNLTYQIPYVNLDSFC